MNKNDIRTQDAAIKPLCELKNGQEGSIAYFEPGEISMLQSLGLIPHERVRVVVHSGRHVVFWAGQRKYAADSATVAGIFVRVIP